mmetsp:Transcript_62168/g.200418  ORF Transcript_62168/g.200418 Transcript_62168/m.200418 type:complete len:239 (-) Transcript_62168:541-1257(-)
MDADHHVVGEGRGEVLERGQPPEDAACIVIEARAREAHEGQGVVRGRGPHAVLAHLRQQPQAQLHLPRGDDRADEVEVRDPVPGHAGLAHPVRHPQRAGELARGAVAPDEHVVVRRVGLHAHLLHDPQDLAALLDAVAAVPHAGVHEHLEGVAVGPQAAPPHAAQQREGVLQPAHPHVAGHERVVEPRGLLRGRGALAHGGALALQEVLGLPEPELGAVQVRGPGARLQRCQQQVGGA